MKREREKKKGTTERKTDENEGRSLLRVPLQFSSKSEGDKKVADNVPVQLAQLEFEGRQ